MHSEFPPGKKKDLELKVMCFEHSPLSDHFQGEVVLPLGHLHRNRVLDQWYALARRDKRPVRGEIRLQLELGVNAPRDYVCDHAPVQYARNPLLMSHLTSREYRNRGDDQVRSMEAIHPTQYSIYLHRVI